MNQLSRKSLIPNNVILAGISTKGPASKAIQFPAPWMRLRLGRLGFRTQGDDDVRAYRKLWWRFYLRRSDYDANREWAEMFGIPLGFPEHDQILNSIKEPLLSFEVVRAVTFGEDDAP